MSASIKDTLKKKVNQAQNKAIFNKYGTPDVVATIKGKKVEYGNQTDNKKAQDNNRPKKSAVQTLSSTKKAQVTQQQKAKSKLGTDKKGYTVTDSNKVMQNYANKTGSYDVNKYKKDTFDKQRAQEEKAKKIVNNIKKGNTLNSATKKAGQAAKNTGKFLTDFDYRNKVGEKALMGAGTALSQFSKGALKTIENWGDAARSATDDFNNWVAYKTGIIDKKEYDRQRELTRKSIAADAVGDFWKNNLGWNEENAQALKDYSYVTEDNLLGQLSYGLGQQAPALMIGNTQAVQNLMTNPALQSVAGDGAVKNIARGLIKNAPMNAEIGLRSYGGAVEEALQNGATMEQARRYGLLNAGTEIATEWMTGGIPGVENTTGLFDKGVDALIDKTTGKLKKETSKAIAKSLLSYGFDALGEGLEESVSEIFSPLIKNMTYSNGEKIDWNSVLNAGIMGMLQGGILNAPSAVTNARSDISQARQIDRANQEAARQQAEQQAREELNTAAQSRLNEVYQQNQENAPIFNQQNRMMELAQQQVQAIQQQVQSGQISPQEGTQQIENIKKYLTAQEMAQAASIINETQQSNVIGQEQQNIAQNANNEVVQNQQQSGNLVQDYMNDNYESLVGDYIDQNYGEQQESNLVEDYMNNGEDNLVNDYMNNYEDGNMVENFMNAQNELQQTQQDNISKQSEAFNLGEQEQNNIEKQKAFEKMKEEITTDTIKATIAPYYDTPLTKNNYSEIKNKVDTVFKDTASKIVNMLDGKIKQTTNNIGGFTFSEGENAGSWVKELSYTFELENMSREDAKLFSSLMGDLAYEQQEAVIAATYSNDIDSSNALEFRLKYKDIEELTNALDKFGIHDYTIDTNNKTLQLLEFDLEQPYDTVQKITQLAKELGGDESDGKFTGIQSDYIDKDVRRGIYKEWLETNERGKENRELYSLVKEAYEKVNVQQEGTSDSSFSNEQTNIPETKTEPVVKVDSKEITKAIKDNGEDVFKKIEQQEGKNVRGFVKTVTNATGETELVNAMDGKKITYERESNKKNMSIAENRAKGMEYKDVKQSALDLIHSDKRLNASDQAFIQLAIEQSLQNKDADGYVQLTTDAAIYRTEYARVLQIAGIMKNADPVTQLDALRKIINREKLKNNKAYRDVEINNDLVQKVLDTRNDDGTWNQEKFNEAMDELTTDIAQQTKGTWQEKVNEWRYLAMLGNPKTHFRNILANIAMNGVQSVKDKLAGGLEDITIGTYNKATGKEIQRQRTIKPASSEQKAIANQAVEEYYSKNKERNKYYEGLTSSGLLADIENKRTPFKNKGLGKIVNKVSEWSSSTLDKEDVKFSKSYSKKAMANYMAANNITQADIDANPELVQDALEFGLEQGREATFHQKSQTADSLRKLRQDLRKGSIRSKTLGVLLDSQIPFINTPMNILKTGIDYSPLGFAVTVSDTVNAKPDAKATTFINGLSKQLTGNGLMAVGLLLAKMGYLTSGDSDDDKKSQLESYLGKTDYSLILGNQAYDISWLSPSAMPILVGAEIYKASKREKVDANLLVDILTSTIDPITEMSFMESIQRSIQTFQSGSKALGEVGMNAVSSYLNQFLPTLMSQVATATDTKKRSPSGKTQVEKLINSLKYKTPGLRQTLEPTTDTWGNEKELASNPIQRAFEAFVSPANRSEIKVDKTTKELERIYDNTGSGLPTVKGKTQSVDAQSYVLSGKDYTEFKKTYGKTAKNYLDKLMEQPKYKSADDSEREDMISAVYKYSTYKAKQEYAKKHNIPFEYKQSDGTGYNYPKYYMTIGDEDFLKYIAEKYNK